MYVQEIWTTTICRCEYYSIVYNYLSLLSLLYFCRKFQVVMFLIGVFPPFSLPSITLLPKSITSKLIFYRIKYSIYTIYSIN